MALRVHHVVFTKKTKDKNITHHARIITYPDIQKKKLISLLTNDFEMPYEDIIALYRWEVDDRDPFQATQTILPSSLLLWRKCECYQDTGLVYINSQSATINPAVCYRYFMKRHIVFLHVQNTSLLCFDLIGA